MCRQTWLVQGQSWAASSLSLCPQGFSVLLWAGLVYNSLCLEMALLMKQVMVLVLPLTVGSLWWPAQGCWGGCLSSALLAEFASAWKLTCVQLLERFFLPVFCWFNYFTPMHCCLGYEPCSFGMGEDGFAILAWTGSTWVLVVLQPFPAQVPHWWHFCFTSMLWW